MKNTCQTALLLIVFQCITFNAFTQKFSKALSPFSKIMLSNKINLIIQDGDSCSITGAVENINMDELVVEVKNGTLKIYLKNAEYYEKTKTDKSRGYKRRADYYGSNACVNVFVTCRELKSLEVRGEQKVVCEKTVDVDKFKLFVYGEAHVSFHSLTASKLKSRVYGEADVIVRAGSIPLQLFHVYGESEIDMQNVDNHKTKLTSLGENKFFLSSNNKVKINSIGESVFMYSASSKIRKRIMLGDSQFVKNDIAVSGR